MRAAFDWSLWVVVDSLAWLMDLRGLWIFTIVVRSSVCFLQDAKYVSTVIMSLQRPAKSYVKSNLRRSSITLVAVLYYLCICVSCLMMMYRIHQPFAWRQFLSTSLAEPPFPSVLHLLLACRTWAEPVDRTDNATTCIHEVPCLNLGCDPNCSIETLHVCPQFLQADACFPFLYL
jgi:hypothetical protein